MEINGTEDVGREAGRRAGTGIEDTDPAVAQIGKKILAGIGGRELRHRRVIKSCADNGAAGHVVCTVSIKVDRASESWIAGRAFGYRPAVVRTSDAVVDLLVGRFADIVDKQASCAWLKSEGKRVAEAKRPDRAIASRGSIVERVVGRDGTVGIDAQHLPEQVGKSLRRWRFPLRQCRACRPGRNGWRRHCGWWQS